MPTPPTGTVTFLFTDIEGSTQLLQRLSDVRAAQVFAEHRRLLRAAFEAASGHEIETQGDAFLIAFSRATDAVFAAVAAQRALDAYAWPEGTVVRVRMGLHTGEPTLAAGGYVGLDVHRAARICASGWGGQILLSETTRDLVELDLPEGTSLRDLGSHRMKDLRRPERIFQVLHPDLPADFPPLRSLDALPHNLPIQLTSFIGREREKAEVRRLLSTTRLLTLTGSGGAGKTRLGLDVAAEMLAAFADGVWVVELASLSDPNLVSHTVAAALHVREQPGRPILATLSDYLQNRHLLLVLDNCEHLVAACAHLAEALLGGCTRLQILATSREALGVAGEALYPVPSLSLPDLQRLPSMEDLMKFEAVRLFIERAVSSRPGFAVTSGNAPAVVQTCHRLDGIPLAIELAAARVKVLSVEQIARRLDDRFRLLTGGSRTAPPRHQTLQAAMDWSYDLLSEAERTMLRRLSVFAGGFTLEAAEAVCRREGVQEFEVLDLLSQLVDKSLVLAEPQGGEIRYRLLETVRQYGWDRLQASGEADKVGQRHREVFLGLAEQAEPELQGPDQKVWLDRLETEHDNLRVALERCVEDEHAEAGLRLAGALWRFWEIRSHPSEGRQWLEKILALPGASERTILRAKALNGAGILASHQGEYAAGRVFVEESLAIAREVGDRPGIALSLNLLGRMARDQGDYAAARALFEESLALRRALGDKPGVGALLNNLGLAASNQGDYAAARRLLEESLAIFRELGDKKGITTTLHNLGFTAWNQGDAAAARAFFEESLAIARELGDRWQIAYVLSGLGLVARDQGDQETARSLFEESLAIRRELRDRRGAAYALGNLGLMALYQGDHTTARRLFEESLAIQREVSDRRGIAYSLEAFAGLAAAQGQPERAARLLGAADVLREAINVPLSPSDRADYNRQVSAARAGLDEEAFAAAWGLGRTMILEQAIEYALAKDA